jgi:hypothetical protein
MRLTRERAFKVTWATCCQPQGRRVAHLARPRNRGSGWAKTGCFRTLCFTLEGTEGPCALPRVGPRLWDSYPSDSSLCFWGRFGMG